MNGDTALILRLEAEANELRYALDASVRLQSHYAFLLNTYDGGTRMRFADRDAWLARLRADATPCVA